ncbi:hypothetical protein [Sphingomonas abietis]|uniref:Uncharacterized protein n=1 Tax=Sphingomonas abietis TaxID=3012344 RepID=A0ABY7NK76_9SPHN|nr:hypothetical protein [Sphingomonas abietis]WBO21924.1 hypothetical protein PBT88_17425 [Sphingomonas abietis]
MTEDGRAPRKANRPFLALIVGAIILAIAGIVVAGGILSRQHPTTDTAPQK